MLNDQTNVVNYYLIVVLKFPRSIIINVEVGSSVVPTPFNNLPLLSIDNEKRARRNGLRTVSVCRVLRSSCNYCTWFDKVLNLPLGKGTKRERPVFSPVPKITTAV